MKAIEIDLEVNAAIETRRRSFAETPNDILHHILLGGSTHRSRLAGAAAANGVRPELEELEEGRPHADAQRRTGRWVVEFQGRFFGAHNLKGAYRTVLLLLSEAFPGFLEAFAQERSRSRRFVARSAPDLYLSTPALARKHAAPLKDGWFFDTNLSTDQVARRVRIAARLCGLLYGPDLRVLNNFEQI